jgi:hypothetical protein
MEKINLVLHLRASGDTFSPFRKYFLNYIIEKYNLIEIGTIPQLNYYNDKKINSILIPYGFQYMDNITEKAQFIKNHPEAKIIRFLNEYNLSESSELRKIFKERPIDLLITNYEFEKFKRNYKKRVMINVNCLSYFDFQKSFVNEKKYDLIYYGTFRKDRIKYFKLYFDNNPDIIVSISPKNIKKFRKINCNLKKVIDKIDIGNIHSPLRFFKYSLYIEDEFTHTCYNYPANRYYEALSYDVVLLFDKNCLNTFNRYGIDISDFIVENQEDLRNKIKTLDYEKALKKQKEWIKKVYEDKEQLEKDLKEHLEPIFFGD